MEKCQKCRGEGDVKVRVIHIYPDGEEVEVGEQVVDCQFCEATGLHGFYFG